MIPLGLAKVDKDQEHYQVIIKRFVHERKMRSGVMVSESIRSDYGGESYLTYCGGDPRGGVGKRKGVPSDPDRLNRGGEERNCLHREICRKEGIGRGVRAFPNQEGRRAAWRHSPGWGGKTYKGRDQEKKL